MKNNARDSLIAAAERLFTEKGYEAVSTRELAESAGVNLGSIQYHFGSKAKLFVETVDKMMCAPGCARTNQVPEASLQTQAGAATELCRFVLTFVDYMLRPKGPPACKLIFREILSDKSHDGELSQEITASFVKNFSEPLEEDLLKIVRVLDPEASRDSLRMKVQSILGQCSVYVTHRPFIEKLWQKPLDAESSVRNISRHISEFSLRAFRFPDKFVDEILANSF